MYFPFDEIFSGLPFTATCTIITNGFKMNPPVLFHPVGLRCHFLSPMRAGNQIIWDVQMLLFNPREECIQSVVAAVTKDLTII